jgi:hypothetical protein
VKTQIASLPNLADRHIALILEHESNPIYFKYLWAILLNAHDQGSRVTIFDCDWDINEFTKQEHDHYRKTSISKMRDEFLKTLNEKTDKAVEIVRIKPNEIVIHKNEIVAIRDFSSADERHLQFGNSMRSVFARNYLNSSNFTLRGSRMKKQFRTYTHSFLAMEKVCQTVYSLSDFDLVFIANGRFPSQTAMRLVAESRSLEFFFYEHGMPKGHRFHFAPLQTQEFQKMQEYIKTEFMPKNSEKNEDVYDFSKAWFERQENDANQNPFIHSGPNSATKADALRLNPLAVIFNSSIDERYSNLGVDLNGWKSQKQATTLIARRLSEQGFDVILRIHPNTANKSWWDLVNIVHDLEENGIDYVLPWNGPSTYSLLKEATLVLTWGSTISMEAIGRGIPTVVYGRTMYDQIAGAIIVTPDLLGKIDFRKLANPNPDLGFLAAYVNKNWGYKIKDYCSQSDLVQLEEILIKSGIKNTSQVVPASEKKFLKKIIGSTKALVIFFRRLRRGRYSTANDFRGLIKIFFGEKFANLCANLIVKIALNFKLLSRDGEVSI